MMETDDEPAPMLSAILRARRLPLTERHDAPELLDRGLVRGVELERNLADLARLNRLPGGTAASVAAIRTLGGQRPLRVLDVGTGAADMPLAFAREGWEVVAVDSDPGVRELARRATASTERVRVTDGDACALPFGDGGFDVAHASLLVHHLDPPAVVTALAELRRVARLGVVVNDLRRGWLPLLATAAAVAILGTCRATRHDGLLSVRRAYTRPELDALFEAAGLRVIRRSAGWMPRVVTTATGRES
jgi:ubiquinone/menaquinone biosynthesis C-methylase UbiE